MRLSNTGYSIDQPLNSERTQPIGALTSVIEDGHLHTDRDPEDNEGDVFSDKKPRPQTTRNNTRRNIRQYIEERAQDSSSLPPRDNHISIDITASKTQQTNSFTKKIQNPRYVSEKHLHTQPTCEKEEPLLDGPALLRLK